MDKQQLGGILEKLLKRDTDLGFLSQLAYEDFQNLIACVRSGMDREI